MSYCVFEFCGKENCTWGDTINNYEIIYPDKITDMLKYKNILMSDITHMKVGIKNVMFMFSCHIPLTICRATLIINIKNINISWMIQTNTSFQGLSNLFLFYILYDMQNCEWHTHNPRNWVDKYELQCHSRDL